MEEMSTLRNTADLTTQGEGVNADAEPLAYGAPRILHPVPGRIWTGWLCQAKAVIRLPAAHLWNGKLLIGGTPAVRNEYALDWLLCDIALQRGYAVATCDKATPGLVLRDVSRSMGEWESAYVALVDEAKRQVLEGYGQMPNRTYIAGISNGGYVVRMMMERHAELFDGGVEWEGVLWHTASRHLMTTLPVCVQDYPIYCNWRGDRTLGERQAALQRLLEAGLAPQSSPFWDVYFMVYWVVSLWLYGRSLDVDWKPFAAEWSNDWLRDPSPLSSYPWQERLDVLAARIQPLANTGRLTKPLLSIAGNWDCLVPYAHHAAAYADLVDEQEAGRWHRMYEIAGGNHVDGLLRGPLQGQQPVQPYFEAALYHLEDWVERGVQPPKSDCYASIDTFTERKSDLLSALAESTAETVVPSDRVSESARRMGQE